jgi:FkbM family methyltransferase
MKAALKKAVAGSRFEPVARIWWRRLRVGAEGGRSGRDNAVAVQVMKRVLRADSNWVEVGASTGEFMWHVLRYAPSGRHIAFEPIPEIAARLRAELPPAVSVHAVAASDRSGDSEFQWVVGDPGYSGLRRRAYPKANLEVRTIRVRTARLDDVLSADLPIHAMKVDVEGAELQVFNGARELLRKWRPYVLFEHGPGAADFYGTTPDMIWSLLHDELGFAIAKPADWLAGRAALDRDGFVASFARGECNYLAYPA